MAHHIIINNTSIRFIVQERTVIYRRVKDSSLFGCTYIFVLPSLSLCSSLIALPLEREVHVIRCAIGLMLFVTDLMSRQTATNFILFNVRRTSVPTTTTVWKS